MQKVLVEFFQDRSGSMASIWAETVNGFKVFVKKLQEDGPKDGVEYLFSLTTFDTLIDQPIKEKPIADVNLEALKDYGPRGMTALYDAIGKSLEATKTDAEKYICVIVTDGHENSSREWDKDAVHSAIDAKLNQGNWTFVTI